MIFKQKTKTLHQGFTLAEVLITLAVIGVVASLTIPALITKYEKEQTVVKLKKTYTTLLQAVKTSEIENGPSDDWDWGTAGNSQSIKESFDTHWAPYLKILKKCTSYTDCGYKESTPWAKVTSGENTSLAIFDPGTRTPVILEDGIVFMVRRKIDDKSLHIDLNGGKPPNLLGIDYFELDLYPGKGLIFSDYYSKKIQQDGWQIKDDYPWK